MSIDLARTMQHVAIAGHAGPRELPGGDIVAAAVHKLIEAMKE